MTECQEIANELWRTHIGSAATPIRSYTDAERIAAEFLHDQGSTIRANVAHEIWCLAERQMTRDADDAYYAKIAGAADTADEADEILHHQSRLGE